MSRLVVGPFNRVEGDLEVKLEMSDGHVARAKVVSPLYRGFEQMLQGKNPRDGLVIAPRICGICSVSQSVAAAAALAGVQGLEPAPNGQLVTNIVHAVENIADHLTHFYLFFMPDFTREVYGSELWHAATAERFTALRGSAVRQMLPQRAEFMHIVGTLAGKWPHTLSLQPGGVTKWVAANEVQRLLGLLAGFRRFLEQTAIGVALEQFADIRSRDELFALLESRGPAQSDLFQFLQISEALRLNSLGRAQDRYLSYGAYRQITGHLFARGLRDGDVRQQLNTGLIAEDVSNAWMLGPDTALHPFDGVTEPDGHMTSGYTWCKAPRLAGHAAEVGALARQVVNGHPLAMDLVAEGSNVEARIVARFLEVAILVPEMVRWLREIRPADAFIAHGETPNDGEGAGLVEAARGSLGHWLKVSGGKISNYQIIAPTTWNFSPRDAAGQPGALEAALVGAPVRNGETEPVAVQHIVRSFDPCMVCTVH